MSKTLKKDLYIVVGAGGTGSYFIPNLLNYLNTLTSKNMKRVIIVDGDIVEEKNLLRQGFYTEELNLGKAEAITSRLSEYTFEKVEYNHLNKFINSVNDLVEIAKDGETENLNTMYKEINVISCVDNNMARLRMTFGIFALRETFKATSTFIDSGNSEWNGQTLATVLQRSGKTYLDGLFEKAQAITVKNDLGMSVINTDTIDLYKDLLEYEMTNTTEKHIYSGIFTQMNDWVNNLNKADFEQSCEDVVVSNPQNIGTNMMASNLLLLRLASIHRKEYVGGELQFDASTNTFKSFNYENGSEEGYEERLKEMVEYIKTPIGFLEVFTDYILVENEELPEVHALLENMYNEFHAIETVSTDETVQDNDIVDNMVDELELDEVIDSIEESTFEVQDIELDSDNDSNDVTEQDIELDTDNVSNDATEQDNKLVTDSDLNDVTKLDSTESLVEVDNFDFLDLFNIENDLDNLNLVDIVVDESENINLEDLQDIVLNDLESNENEETEQEDNGKEVEYLRESVSTVQVDDSNVNNLDVEVLDDLESFLNEDNSESPNNNSTSDDDFLNFLDDILNE